MFTQAVALLPTPDLIGSQHLDHQQSEVARPDSQFKFAATRIVL